MSEHDNFFRNLKGQLNREEAEIESIKRRVADEARRQQESYTAFLRDGGSELDRLAETKLLLSMANEQLFDGRGRLDYTKAGIARYRYQKLIPGHEDWHYTPFTTHDLGRDHTHYRRDDYKVWTPDRYEEAEAEMPFEGWYLMVPSRRISGYAISAGLIIDNPPWVRWYGASIGTVLGSIHSINPDEFHASPYLRGFKDTAQTSVKAAIEKAARNR